VVPVPQAPALEPEAPKLEAPAAGVGADASAAPSEETAGADASAAPPPEPEAAGSGETCVLTAVTFEPNQTELGDEHQEALRAFAACVKENPEQTITLEGRADPRGNAEYNEGLAKRRAASVAKALEAHGVPGDKLTTSIGTQVCSEATEECWQKNRSVSASAR
jgi:outer membrane protein OmpA-like peptidoglycan-associated protein